jgi:hypothetical protein
VCGLVADHQRFITPEQRQRSEAAALEFARAAADHATGEIRAGTFPGRLMRYTVQIGDQEWLVDQPDPGGTSALEGAVHVAINPSRIHVIAAAKEIRAEDVPRETLSPTDAPPTVIPDA